MPLINVSEETADSIYWALRMARNAPTNDAIHIEVYDKALREFEASRRAALSREHAQPQVWREVTYKDIYTPLAKPSRSDYGDLCERWSEFHREPLRTEDGHEYAICRRVAQE